MVAIKNKAKRRQRPSCSKWIIFLLAVASPLLPIIFIKVSQSVSIFNLESISSLQRTATTAEPIAVASAKEESPSLSEELPSPRPSYHVIFSTGCSPQQNWQSYFFFYHALAVHQPGNVTRIASGCSKSQMVELYVWHERYITPMSKNFLLHFTPDYSKIRVDERWSDVTYNGTLGKDHTYKYMNKPHGVLHWMEHYLGMNQKEKQSDELRDGIVMLLDPDMILLRPLLHDFTHQNVLWAEDAQPATTVVRHGYPMAQQDGYMNSEWMSFNASYITNKTEGSYKGADWEAGPRMWNSGPPYLATVSDMYNIALLWSEYTPRVLDVYPKLFAEMYGFVVATVQLDLPMTLVRSMVVSGPSQASPNREGWPYIDALPDDQVCHPISLEQQSNNNTLPMILHYCQEYGIGKWFFSKYRLKKNIMDCDKALLKKPPRDLVGHFNYSISPRSMSGTGWMSYKEERVPVDSVKAKRQAFMICGMTHAVNEALRYHKRRACGANLDETYTVHDDPTDL